MSATSRSFALALILFAWGCDTAPVDDTEAIDAQTTSGVLKLPESMVERGELEILTVQRRALQQTLEVTGRIQLDEDRTARVGSLAEGRVSRLFVSLGARVVAGAPLVQIHSHELIVARSDYTKASTALTAAERRRRFARTELERADRLLKAKALSERERLTAESELIGAEAEWERARSELGRAEHYLLHLGVSETDDDTGGDLTITAPIDGVVLERHVTLGTVVNPTDDLIVLSDIGSLWVVGEVPEREASRVAVGQEIAVSTAAFPGESFAASIFHIAEELDPELRTVSVRARLTNPDRKLRPGMYVGLSIAGADALDAVAVPERAIHLYDGSQVVFVVVGDGRFEMRPVETASSASGWVEIASGLAEGDRIVGSGSFLVKSEFLRGDFGEEH